jgi:diguanylate cyclase (GGDEF)-like protein/PAS domain S-box-containing protein
MLIPLLALAVILAQAAWIYLVRRRSRNREELFRIITENAADMIALVDVKGHRLYNSPSYEKILGYSPDELARTPIFEQIHPDDRFKVLEAGREARSTGIGQSLQYRLRHKNGDWRVLESTASTIKNDRGEVEKLVIVNRDVTQRVSAEEKLAHNALHDGLTDLPNRRLFLDRLEHCFARAQQDHGFHYALLLLDLDAFKSLNHTLGPAAGDEVLIETAHRLQSALRATDGLSRPGGSSADALASRLGGDEFAILLEACADPSDVLRIAERIHEVLSVPMLPSQHEVQMRVSIGCALVSAPPERAEDPLRDAETALRRAQAMGGNRSELFDPAMHQRAVTRLKLESDLRTALKCGQFRVFYQPIFRIHPREIVAFEALLRWQHPEQGLISLDEFLEAAEDTGLMALVDHWVIEETCRNLPVWESIYRPSSRLQAVVNLSARHFASDQLVEGVKKRLFDAAVPPDALQLAITEAVAMANPQHTIQVLSQLKRLRVTTTIDDFGRGNFSLPALRQSCPDFLKIDRLLIANMQADRAAHDVIDLILTLARKLNCAVVAQGVEKSAQLEHLCTLGCNLAQGYLLSSPLDPDAVLELLRLQVQSKGASAATR